MVRRAVACRRNDLHSAEGLRLCFPFRPGYGARNIADIVKVRRLAVSHAFHLLMYLRHFSVAEARRLADSQRMDIHLRQRLHLHGEPKRLFKGLGSNDQTMMADLVSFIDQRLGQDW